MKCINLDSVERKTHLRQCSYFTYANKSRILKGDLYDSNVRTRDYEYHRMYGIRDRERMHNVKISQKV